MPKKNKKQKNKSDWVELELVNAKDNSYTNHKKSYCESCGAIDNLSVHHGFPQDAIKAFQLDKIKANTLYTLCEPCHTRYEREANYVRLKLRATNPKLRAFDRASSYYSKLKQKSQLKKMTKDEVEFALEYLSIYTDSYVTLSNLPASIRQYNTCIYDNYELKQIEKLWKSHFNTWLLQERMMFNI
jgi:hypothetical protein